MEETQAIEHIKYGLLYFITKYIAVFWNCISVITNSINKCITNNDSTEPVVFMEHKREGSKASEIATMVAQQEPLGKWLRNDENNTKTHSISSAILIHWGRVTHICVGNLTFMGSDNGLSPGRRQAIIWTNAEILLIGPLGTNFSEILIEIPTFSFKKLRLRVSSAKWRPFCLGLNVLMPERLPGINGFLTQWVSNVEALWCFLFFIEQALEWTCKFDPLLAFYVRLETKSFCFLYFSKEISSNCKSQKSV